MIARVAVPYSLAVDGTHQDTAATPSAIGKLDCALRRGVGYGSRRGKSRLDETARQRFLLRPPPSSNEVGAGRKRNPNNPRNRPVQPFARREGGRKALDEIISNTGEHREIGAATSEIIESGENKPERPWGARSRPTWVLSRKSWLRSLRQC